MLNQRLHLKTSEILGLVKHASLEVGLMNLYLPLPAVWS